MTAYRKNSAKKTVYDSNSIYLERNAITRLLKSFASS